MKTVKEYYTEIGWSKQKGEYIDTLMFTSEKGKKYKKICNDRLKEKIGNSDLLLDIGCGARPFDSTAKKQVCADFSITAVKEAKKNKPDGLFLLADITCLPLKDNSVSDTLSLHTIYHVHKDKQMSALEEIKRVTKNKCYVVYNAGKHATIVNILTLPLQLWNWSEKRINPNSKRKLYFYAHNYKWLEQFGKIETHRLFNENGIKLYNRLLWLVSKIETHFPKHAYHPLLIIDKTKSNK
jgi:ubiquinone/menaquinone biosynthesis C-methylase UbiE